MPNIPDINKMQMMGYLNAPPDIQAGASEIFRQQQLADLLRKQAIEPIKADEYTKSGSGQWAAPPQIVPVGIGQGLAKMGTALVGGYMDKKASEDSLALANKLRDRRQGVIDQVSSAMTGTPYKQGGTPDAIGDQPAGAVYTDDYTPVPAADQQGYKTLGTPATLPADRKQIASLLMNSGFPDLEKMGEQQLFAKPDKIEFIHGKPGEVIQQVQPDGSLKEVMRVPEKTQFESMSNEEKLVRSTLLAKGIKEGTPEWNAAAAPLFNKLMDKKTNITVHTGGTDKVPMGYRKLPNGNLEAIPGGPADNKLQGIWNADTASFEASNAALNRLAEQVNLVKNSNLSGITGIRGAIPNIPGSASADAQARLEALRSQVGFNVMQALKDSSKTGSTGLGSVTEGEHKLLQAQLGNLQKAQSEDEIRRVLEDIMKFTEDSKGRLLKAYNRKHTPSETESTPSEDHPDVAKARLAIAAGADKTKVNARLKDAGLPEIQ